MTSRITRQFLESPVGSLFWAHLGEARGQLATGVTDINAVALRAAEVAGFETALRTVLSLAEPPKAVSDMPDNYPPLDDDTKWNSN